MREPPHLGRWATRSGWGAPTSARPPSRGPPPPPPCARPALPSHPGRGAPGAGRRPGPALGTGGGALPGPRPEAPAFVVTLAGRRSPGRGGAGGAARGGGQGGFHGGAFRASGRKGEVPGKVLGMEISPQGWGIRASVVGVDICGGVGVSATLWHSQFSIIKC